MAAAGDHPHDAMVRSLARSRWSSAVPVAVLATSFALVSPPAASASATLDPSYGEDGVATLWGPPYGVPPQPYSPYVFGASADELGRAVVLGTTGGDGVWRLTPSGQPDASFGTDGVVVLPEALSPYDVEASADAVFIGGRTAAGAALAKLLPDGQLDPDFGDSGMIVLDGTEGQHIFTMDPAPDGAVAVSVTGPSMQGEPYSIWRIEPDGSLDADFGEGGVVAVSAYDELVQGGFNLAVDAQDRIAVLDYLQPAPEAYTMQVSRLLPDGSRDPSFGTGGIVQVPDFGGQVVDIAHDGGILIGGVSDPSDAGAAVMKLDAGGRPDPRFGTDGVAKVAPAELEAILVWSMTELSDGRIAVQADSRLDDPSLVSILRPDGTREPSIGTDGVLVSDQSWLIRGGAVGEGADGQLLVVNAWPGGNVPDEEQVSTVRAYSLDLPTVAPTISATEVHHGSVWVSWERAEVELGAQVRSFLVTAYGEDGALVSHRLVAGDVRQVSLPDVGEDGSYSVAVLPYDELGPVVASEPVVVEVGGSEPLEVAPSGPVTDLTAVPGSGFVTAGWAPPADDGGAPILGYSVVAVRKETGDLAAWRNVPADLRSLSLPELTDGVAHDVYVVPYSAAGFGDVAEPVTVTPASDGVEAEPPDVSWTAAGRFDESRVVVSWGPPVEKGEALEWFHVIVVEDGELTAWQVLDPARRQAVVPAATGATVYVIASNASGTGEPASLIVND